MSYIGAIYLHAEERALFGKVSLDADPLSAAAYQNGRIVPELMEMLEARGAIPKCRIDYFNDPEFRTGVPKGSHRNLFERNNTRGREIYEHYSFLKYLRYFVLGANLPEPVIQEFRAEVERRAPISPGDALDLSMLAKDMMDEHRLAPHEKAEEFFKLCLDCGVYHGHAQRVKDAVAKMRLRK